MATYASDSGGGKDFDPVPEGSHLAVCDMFVDLGIQETNYNGQVKQQHKIYLRWQIPSLRLKYEKDGVEHEGPMAIGSKFTLSLHEKAALRKILQSWRGRAFTPDELKKFDVTTVLGAPCLITVTHAPKDGGGVYANVGAVAKLPPGVPAPTIEGETLIYDADNLGNFEKLRPWLQDAIKAQKLEESPPEQRGEQQPAYADLDDDVPF
jgi:hypothetical protein